MSCATRSGHVLHWDPQARPLSAGVQRKEEAQAAEQQQQQAEGTPHDAGADEDDELAGRLADAVLLNEELEQRVAQLTRQAGRMRK